MKKLVCLLLALSLLLSLAACSSKQETTPAPEPAPSETSQPEAEAPTEEEPAAETPEETAEPTEAASDGAFDWNGSGTVTVYCGSGSDICEQYFAAFTELTGVKVEAVYGGGGELLARVAAEAENPLGDVLIGATSDNLTSYTDYFEKFTLESVTAEELGLETLEEGYWTEGAGGNIMVFLINTDLLDEEDYPTSWADLTDEKYFGQIAFCDPTASSSAYIQLNCMLQLYGWDFLEKFYQNLDGKMINSSSTVPKVCADGEYAVALTIENYGADYSAAGSNIKVVYPEDGTMRTAGGSVILKNCKNPENAKLFVEFMYSKAAAEINVSFNRRCERTDVALPHGLAPFEEIKFMDYDYDAAADSESVLEKWNEIVINN